MAESARRWRRHMTVRLVILVCTGLLLAHTLRARDQSDVVVLMNGDRLTGEVKSLKAGILYVSLDYVDWHYLGAVVEGGPTGK
jgi:hypothetical protein